MDRYYIQDELRKTYFRTLGRHTVHEDDDQLILAFTNRVHQMIEYDVRLLQREQPQALAPTLKQGRGIPYNTIMLWIVVCWVIYVLLQIASIVDFDF
ncbi:MAG: hypothetical protein EB075_07130 [Bacteroidetes bacterium]|nr:hypothetical protein [Bacteroidota bacterium]